MKKRVLQWLRALLQVVAIAVLTLVFALGIAFTLAWMRLIEKATIKDFLDVGLLAALVIGTFWYARRTEQIAEATADSVAEAIKQRYLATQPWVFPDLTIAGEYRLVTDAVPVKNIGKGPAIDLKVIISNENNPVDKRRIEQIQKDFKRGALTWANQSTGRSWPYLEPDDCELLKDDALQKAQQGQTGIIAVEYKDIHGRGILSGWAYRVEKGSEERMVLIPGEPIYPVVRAE